MTDNTAEPEVPQPGNYPEEQYRQWREDFRQLNGIFWQMPILASTTVGGLWLGVATLDITAGLRTGMLIVAAVFCVIMMLIIWRLRMSVMASLLRWLDSKEEGRKDKGKKRINYFVASAFMALLGLSGLGSLLGAVAPNLFFTEKSKLPKLSVAEIEAFCKAPVSAATERAEAAERMVAELQMQLSARQPLTLPPNPSLPAPPGR